MFWVPLDIFPEVGSQGQKADPFLIFWGVSTLLSTVAAPGCIPTNSAQGFPFLHNLTSTVVCWFIDNILIKQKTEISFYLLRIILDHMNLKNILVSFYYSFESLFI